MSKADARAEIEESLADAFDESTLAVYADYLQSIDDPRGDLIALDLAGDTSDARERAVVAWLGDELAQLLGSGAVEVGFIADLHLEDTDPQVPRMLELLLASPSSAYIRGLTISGDGAWVAQTLEPLVAGGALSWLDRLSLQTSGPTSPAIANGLAARLIAATPLLVELELCGSQIFDAFEHPAIRSAHITGFDALGSLSGRGAPLPSLQLVDLAFATWASADRRAALLLPERVPSLRRLDLSRNEPGTVAPYWLGATVDVVAFVSQLASRERLTHLRLPSIRSQPASDRLATAIASMPMLRALDVVRSYAMHPFVNLPAMATVPLPFPWPPGSSVAAELIALDVSVPLPALIAWAEDHFANLPYESRELWRALFTQDRYWKPSRLLTLLRDIDAVGDLAPIEDLRTRLATTTSDVRIDGAGAAA